jgi:galactokinase
MMNEFLGTLRERAAGFFDREGPITVARAPGRLDVMGGVADYSGSVVLEATLAESTCCAFQWRSDDRVRLWSDGIEADGLEPRFETRLEAIAAEVGSDWARRAHECLTADARTRWAAYVAGCFPVLVAEGIVPSWRRGTNIYLRSDVPLGAGVSSSAAVEVPVMRALTAAAGLSLDGLQLARLCQQVENHVAGAPCGIMDQVTCALGEAGRLLALRCQPHEILGHVAVPDGCRLFGLHSGVKHAVGGSRYGRARCAAFMGLAILAAEAPDLDLNSYLCNLTPDGFRAHSHLLPGTISGAEFLHRCGKTADTITRVDPKLYYSVRGAVEHAVYENSRVQRFIRCLRDSAEARGPAAEACQSSKVGRSPSLLLEEAGKLMYASHWSYGKRIGLGAAETDLIVRLVRERGPRAGLYGAKITGGGSGGTVAILAAADAEPAVREIAAEYGARTGQATHLFAGTSPGALASGWQEVAWPNTGRLLLSSRGTIE